MKKSKRGCGDWMLGQFAAPYQAVKSRDKNRKMDAKRLWGDFRKNLLKTAYVGGGFQFDIAIKQASGSKGEVDFLSDLFGQPPCEIVFMYREPHGWWLSSKKKFNYSDEEMKRKYANALDNYDLLRGIPICYDETLISQLKSYDIFNGIKFDEFKPKPCPDVPGARELMDLFEKRKLEFKKIS
ncbi:hypothetical protein N9135_01810 [Akkermansiaceae bacterium]|nr:hypothetical protein [Akkermansiaceae bacterium]